MPRLRLAASVVLGVSALLAAMTWVPATALAQNGISIISAGPDGSGDPYNLTVVANDQNGIALSGMTVHLSQGTNDVYDVMNMQPVDVSDPTNETWAPASSIPAVDLPAGTYTIAVDASDSTGESDSGIPAGTITISYSATTVSIIPTATFVTEGEQNVTFNGTVTGTAEDGTQVPITGVGVAVSTDSGAKVTTDSGGAFSYTAANVAHSTTFDFSVAAAGDGSYPAGSGSVTITAEPATTSINITPSQTTVSQGSEQIIFTGYVTAVPAGGGAAVPVGGAAVSVTGGGASGQETTASDGSFSYEATGVTSATTFSFSVDGTDVYGPGSASVPIGTAQSQTKVSVKPSQSFVTQGATGVTFSGTVTVIPPGSSSAVGIGSGVPVTISAGGSPIATVNTDASSDFSYTATGITQPATAFDFSVGSTSLYGAADQTITIPANPASTAVSVTPSPPQIELGSQKVTFTGSVTMTPPGSTTPVSIGGGIPVTVSGGSFSTVAPTDSSGNFSVTVPSIPQATNFTVSVAGATLYGASSVQTQITEAQPAQSTISINTPALITFGTPSTTISGTVTGLNASSASVPISGAPVYLNGGSSPVATTDTSGHFSYPTPALTASANYTFSINADADGLYTATSTPTQVGVAAGSTTMAVTTNPAIVSKGPQPVVFTGTVSVTPAGPGTTAEPIGANVPVQVSRNGGFPVLAGVTDASGTFTYSIPDAMPGDEYDFGIAGATLYTTATSDIGFNKESTTLAVQPSQMSVTEGSQSVTFDGTATGLVPGGTTEPVAGAQVLLNGQPITGVLTSPSGTFTYTINGISKTTSYQFSISADPNNTYTAATADIVISVSQARTRIAGISVFPSKLKYGQTTTLRGTVQYLSGTTWKGLGGATVHVAEGTTSITTVRAGTGGAFAATLPSTHGFGWSATVRAGILTQQATATGNLSIWVPMKVEMFSAALHANGYVSSRGCLVVTVPVRYGPQTTVQIQYAAGPGGAWHLLGQLQLHNYDRKITGCSGPNESYFSGAIRAVRNSAYYRAVFPATSKFQRAVSAVIHCWRYKTRITSFAVAPTTVKIGQTITMTGRLWRSVRGIWYPYSYRKVEIIYNEKGTSFWSNLGTVKTNSKGYFRQTAAGGGGNFTAILYAEYWGSSVDLAVRSPGIAVTIEQSTAVTGTTQVSATPMSAAMASPGAESDMLTRQNLLILGITPGAIPTPVLG